MKNRRNYSIRYDFGLKLPFQDDDDEIVPNLSYKEDKLFYMDGERRTEEQAKSYLQELWNELTVEEQADALYVDYYEMNVMEIENDID